MRKNEKTGKESKQETNGTAKTEANADPNAVPEYNFNAPPFEELPQTAAAASRTEDYDNSFWFPGFIIAAMVFGLLVPALLKAATLMWVSAGVQWHHPRDNSEAYVMGFLALLLTAFFAGCSWLVFVMTNNALRALPVMKSIIGGSILIGMFCISISSGLGFKTDEMLSETTREVGEAIERQAKMKTSQRDYEYRYQSTAGATDPEIPVNSPAKQKKRKK